MKQIRLQIFTSTLKSNIAIVFPMIVLASLVDVMQVKA
jgi:predicted proteasome-type protease